MDTSLPNHLSERLRWLSRPDEGGHDPGEFVLYWMHNALRAHENPALDTAICLARQNGLPLLVYHGLSEDYPFASDRLHAFMLQGHRDVERELADRNIAAAFHLQRQGNRGPYLRNLTRAAAVLVTEEMPVQPLTGWMERLVATCRTPIATVDCSCIAPVTLFDRAHTRAFEFRNQVQPIYDERIEREYEEQVVDVERCDLDLISRDLDLHPISLQDADLSSLIGQCRVDHSIAPVADTPGGTRAGYARWNAFMEDGLNRYQKSRNDPTAPAGSSRMSAYLHYGMVSPFRIAREASKRGASKFLDELLVWRELAFHFCFHHRENIDSLEALPDWAQSTLQAHHDDPRDEDCSWETLARGGSGRPLWDAAQRSLIKHGELHNNVRMTWGKAILPWLCTPARALQIMLDLNHRYSLDGRNPASYGGILWCFGQFDRPFSPETPVLGSVRSREIDSHARRMDLGRFIDHVDRPIAAKLPRVAVVGAGIGGLAAARTLRDHGIDVTLFDKSRGPGGRTANRRVASEVDGRQLSFDHGAQYFTARDSRFCRYVNSWMHDGLVETWMGRIVHLSSDGKLRSEKSRTPRYVGTPAMNAVAKHLAKDLNIQFGARIKQLTKRSDRWELETQSGEKHRPFDLVLCNCPPAQSLALLDGHTDVAETIRKVRMRPCWAIMVADEALGDVDFDGAFIDDSEISWIARDDRKPGRQGIPKWTIHATAQWSEDHLESEPQAVIDQLLPVFESVIGKRISRPHYLTAHRWRYAIADQPLDEDCLFDRTAGLGACGDWCGGTRVEAAFLSGVALAGTILRHYTVDRPAFPSDVPRQRSLFAS